MLLRVTASKVRPRFPRFFCGCWLQLLLPLQRQRPLQLLRLQLLQQLQRLQQQLLPQLPLQRQRLLQLQLLLQLPPSAGCAQGLPKARAQGPRPRLRP